MNSETETMNCPLCDSECGRDEVHNGVCMLYGPWGCNCGWSEDSRYNLHLIKQPVNGTIDSRGGFTPLDGPVIDIEF